MSEVDGEAAEEKMKKEEEEVEMVWSFGFLFSFTSCGHLHHSLGKRDGSRTRHGSQGQLASVACDALGNVLPEKLWVLASIWGVTVL